MHGCIPQPPSPLGVPGHFRNPSWDDETWRQVRQDIGMEMDLQHGCGWESHWDQERFNQVLPIVVPKAARHALDKIAAIKRAKSYPPEVEENFERWLLGHPLLRTMHLLPAQQSDPFEPAAAPTDSKPPRKRTYWVEDDAADADVSWLVDDLAQRGGIGFLAGASGSGKTFIAVHKALCGALGRPFFGRQTSERFGTYIIAAEGSHSLSQRVRTAAVHAFGVPASEALKSPIAYCKDVPNLLTKAGLESLLEELAAVDKSMRARYGVPLGLVIVDTFGQTFALDDENAAAQANRATKPMLAIAQATGATVLATHHFGHVAQRMRGSTALRANADFVIEARKDGELFLEKCRDGAEVRLGWYELPIVEVGTKADGSPITSRYVREIAHRRPRADNPANGFAAIGQEAAASNQDFDNAFGSVAAVGQGGVLEASVPAVKAAFYSLRKGNSTASRKAWSRACQKARVFGYCFSDDLISKSVQA